MHFGDILKLADIARDLSEPGEPNSEYIRGQVNLICDASGIAFAGDIMSDALTAYISHETTEPLVYTLAAILANHAKEY